MPNEDLGNMKRHQSLYPLSHDHHHALVQARNLIVASTGDRNGLGQAAERFIGFWESELHNHFLQEEQIVLPLLALHAPPDITEPVETLKQHLEITQLVDELAARLAKRESIEASLLNTIGEALRSHIHFEENKLFPAIEASVPEEELWQMNRQLTKDRPQS